MRRTAQPERNPAADKNGPLSRIAPETRRTSREDSANTPRAGAKLRRRCPTSTRPSSRLHRCVTRGGESRLVGDRRRRGREVRMRRKLVLVGAVVLAMAMAGVAVANGPCDWGLFRDRQLASHSVPVFGVGKPLPASSSTQVTKQQALADPQSLFTLANGLQARVVTTQSAPVIDQISLWPNDANPQWLIACNEDGTSDPGLQRINIATGEAATIVTGTEDCDPTRRTPWGTIVFGEEDGSGPNGGAIYELMGPNHTTNVHLNRSTGTFSGGTGASNLVARPALARASFDGLPPLDAGVTSPQPT